MEFGIATLLWIGDNSIAFLPFLVSGLKLILIRSILTLYEQKRIFLNLVKYSMVPGYTYINLLDGENILFRYAELSKNVQLICNPMVAELKYLFCDVVEVNLQVKNTEDTDLKYHISKIDVAYEMIVDVTTKSMTSTKKIEDPTKLNDVELTSHYYYYKICEIAPEQVINSEV